jgi:hypothetical protein
LTVDSKYSYGSCVPLLIDNQKNVRIQKQSTVDTLGILLNILSVIICSFPVSCAVIVLLDYDPMYPILPSSAAHRVWVITLRCILLVWTSCELCYTAGAAHLILITLALHTNSLFGQIHSFRNQMFLSNHKIMFRNRDDIHIYKLSSYFLGIAKEYFDVLLVFTIFPVAFLDITFNYALLKFYREIPFILYFFVCVGAVLIPIIITLEISEAGKSYDTAKKCVWQLKGTTRYKKSLRYKRASACKPLGYTMGGMFTLTSITVTKFGKALLECTINAILLL